MEGITDKEKLKAEQIAADWGIGSVYESHREAAKTWGTDAVYDIATPPQAILTILPDLPIGAAVLMQKPMGTNLEQAKSIRRICRDHKLKAAVNFQLRFSPMMMAARDALQQGLIGNLLELEVHINLYTPWHMFPFLIPMDRVEIAVHSIHYLDAIRALAGNPQGVFVRSMHDPRAGEFAQTRTSAILDYGKVLRAVLSINHNHPHGRKFQSAWFRIEGSKGAMMIKLGVLYDYPKGEADELWLCRKGEEWEQIHLEGSWFIDAFMGTMRNVQRFDSSDDDALDTSFEDAYQTMALAEACFQSLDVPGTPLDLSE